MNHEPLPPDDARALAEYLASPARSEGTLSYHELQGFLFTVATAPALLTPEDWLPLIFAEEEFGGYDPNERHAALERIMSLYNSILADALEGQPTLPDDCRFRDEILDNLEEDAPVSQWSRGFAQGYTWLGDAWGEALPETLDQEFGAMLSVLMFFSTRSVAQAFMAELKAPEPSLEEHAARMRDVFPDALTAYAGLALDIQEARRQIEAEQSYQAEFREPVRREHEKIGRNQPCPCGSGKKYKKCCGAMVH